MKYSSQLGLGTFGSLDFAEISLVEPSRLGGFVERPGVVLPEDVPRFCRTSGQVVPYDADA